MHDLPRRTWLRNHYPCDPEVALKTPPQTQRNSKMRKKWLESDFPGLGGSDSKATRKWLRSDFSDRFRQFWVTFESLFAETWKVTLESLFRIFEFFPAWASVGLLLSYNTTRQRRSLWTSPSLDAALHAKTEDVCLPCPIQTSCESALSPVGQSPLPLSFPSFLPSPASRPASEMQSLLHMTDQSLEGSLASDQAVLCCLLSNVHDRVPSFHMPPTTCQKWLHSTNWRRKNLGHTILLEIITFLSRKPLNHVIAIAEKFLGIPEGNSFL